MSHPITPSPELVQQWYDASRGPRFEQELATQAARWASDQELEACCELLDINGCSSKWIDMLRDARRPKPPSLAERAMEALQQQIDKSFKICPEAQKRADLIRTALERLQQLEQENND